jgi:RimJ/RimL family protein N-acetyltransferase
MERASLQAQPAVLQRAVQPLTAYSRSRVAVGGLTTMDASFEQQLVLDDGRAVLLRGIRPSDAALLREGYARLSPASRYARFFTSMKELPPDLLRRLTHVDGVDHCAVVAVMPARGPAEKAHGLGVARFVRQEDPKVAEVAVTIADEVQGAGLAPRLLCALAEAAQVRGIDTFVACSLSDNLRARRLLSKLGAERVRSERNLFWYRLPVERVANLSARPVQAA